MKSKESIEMVMLESQVTIPKIVTKEKIYPATISGNYYRFFNDTLGGVTETPIGDNDKFKPIFTLKKGDVLISKENAVNTESERLVKEGTSCEVYFITTHNFEYKITINIDGYRIVFPESELWRYFEKPK